MRILGHLTEKPWLTPGPLPERPERSAAPAGVGLFLCVVTVLFSLITLAYLMRMGSHGPAIDEPVHDWAAVREPPLLWFNTAILALGSVAFEMARTAARRNDAGGLRNWLLVAGLLTLVFLGGQLAVWQQLAAAGYFLSSQPGICTIIWSEADQPVQHFITGNPAVAFFYLITALHGLHLLGGLFFWSRATVRVFEGVTPVGLRPHVDLCAFYWHFLLLVWLLMFGLFLMT